MAGSTMPSVSSTGTCSASGFALFGVSTCPQNSFASLTYIAGDTATMNAIPKTAKSVKRRSVMIASAMFSSGPAKGYESLSG